MFLISASLFPGVSHTLLKIGCLPTPHNLDLNLWGVTITLVLEVIISGSLHFYHPETLYNTLCGVLEKVLEVIISGSLHF